MTHVYRVPQCYILLTSRYHMSWCFTLATLTIAYDYQVCICVTGGLKHMYVTHAAPARFIVVWACVQ